jgi:hypothetical protein
MMDATRLSLKGLKQGVLEDLNFKHDGFGRAVSEKVFGTIPPGDVWIGTPGSLPRSFDGLGPTISISRRGRKNRAGQMAYEKLWMNGDLYSLP